MQLAHLVVDDFEQWGIVQICPVDVVDFSLTKICELP